MTSEVFVPTEEMFSISKASRPDIKFVSDSHYHNTYEIYYLISGTRRQFVNHTVYDMKRGDLLLIPKGAIHKTTAIDKNSHTRYVINFTDDFVSAICRDMGADTLKKIFSWVKLSVPDSRRDYILGLFDRMSEEQLASDSDSYADVVIRSYLTELFVFICRYNAKRTSDDIIEAIPEEKIQLAAKYIYDRYNQPLTLSEVAGYVYMSESYFSRKFKKVTGLNFSEYLTSTRIKAADEMLLQTDKSVAQIAEACGFQDANYFGDIFKKRKGASPLKYRRFKGRL